MAQSQTATNQGLGELGKFVAGEAATRPSKVVGLGTACTAAAVGSTYATPAGAKLTLNGFAEVAAATVVSSTTTQANDTVEIDHVFTATGTQTVNGFGVTNTDSDVLYAECCFNAGVAMESSDTLTIEMKMQLTIV